MAYFNLKIGFNPFDFVQYVCVFIYHLFLKCIIYFVLLVLFVFVHYIHKNQDPYRVIVNTVDHRVNYDGVDVLLFKGIDGSVSIHEYKKNPDIADRLVGDKLVRCYLNSDYQSSHIILVSIVITIILIFSIKIEDNMVSIRDSSRNSIYRLTKEMVDDDGLYNYVVFGRSYFSSPWSLKDRDYLKNSIPSIWVILKQKPFRNKIIDRENKLISLGV